jgi:hypothetical protein
MYSNQKTEQQATDKMYHIYDDKGVVIHSLSEEDFDLLYDATKQNYEECVLDKSSEEHSY